MLSEAEIKITMGLLAALVNAVLLDFLIRFKGEYKFLIQ